MVNLWGQETTLCGQILVSRTGDDPLFPLPFLLRVCIRNVPLCTFETSPCVPAPRPHALSHAGVVPVHTEVFLNVHTGTPHTPHNTDRETQRDTERHRERQRETRKDKRRSKTCEETCERRDEKRQEKKQDM